MFSKILGKALLFLSGAGKEYKDLKKHMNEPDFKKRWDSMGDRAKQLAKEYEDLKKKYK